MTAKATKGGVKVGGTRRGIGELLTPKGITVLLLVVLALVFIFENTRETEIRLLVPEVEMPLWLALLGTGIVGALCGAYFMRRRG